MTETFYYKLLQRGCDIQTARSIIDGFTFPGEADNSPVVYIAGPMSGYPNYNFEAFDATRNSLLFDGYVVLSPADIDRAIIRINSSRLDDYIYRDFYALWLLANTWKEPRMLFLPGWQQSVGANAEKALGKWLGFRTLRRKKDARQARTI